MKLESLIDVMKDNKPQPMSKEDTEVFLQCGMIELQKPDLPTAVDDKSPLGLQILQGRLEWAGIADKVSFPVKMFISCLCDRPGKVVMWAYTLAHILEKNPGLAKVNMAALAEEFPVGFPDDDVCHACWDAQKGHPHGEKRDNLMDVLEWWKS